MKVLVALPVEHKHFDSVDDVISGYTSCSGTDGSIIRLAYLLNQAGIQVLLSAACKTISTSFQCISHADVDIDQFDYLIAHQSHWTGVSLSFGNHALVKTVLWLHTHVHQTLIHTFLQEGGYQIVCPSEDHANTYRALASWEKKVTVIYNSYSSTFHPTSLDIWKHTKLKLLFIGAITPIKGFIELTQIWSCLSKYQVEIELAIAGSISLHTSNVQTGKANLAESVFETTVIQPWINSLPDNYQPHFLGALSPVQLQMEISKSHAVIVNPSFRVPETFCVAAIDAQACNRTVFSVNCGALSETVYQGKFNTLTKDRSTEAFVQNILKGLSNRNLIEANGQLAGEFVRRKFNSQSICNSWISLLTENRVGAGLSLSWDSLRNVACDLMRWSKTWKLINHYRNSEHRQIMQTYQKFKQTKRKIKTIA